MDVEERKEDALILQGGIERSEQPLERQAAVLSQVEGAGDMAAGRGPRRWLSRLPRTAAHLARGVQSRNALRKNHASQSHGRRLLQETASAGHRSASRVELQGIGVLGGIAHLDGQVHREYQAS
jgi:hypothetical protein